MDIDDDDDDDDDDVWTFKNRVREAPKTKQSREADAHFTLDGCSSCGLGPCSYCDRGIFDAHARASITRVGWASGCFWKTPLPSHGKTGRFLREVLLLS